LGAEDLSALAAEQAALRRVAALVAGGAAPEEAFAAVVEEIGRLLPVEYAGMGRFEPDDSVTYLAAWGTAFEPVAARSQLTLGGKNLATIVFQTGRPARIDNYADASGPLGVTARETGARSAVATPIIVEGRLWGVMGAGSTLEQPLPADTEARLASFTELLATTIANAESRAGVSRMVADQAALRRVATLVARAVPPEDVFAAVVEEIGRLLPVDFADLGRCEPDGTITFLAAWGKTRPVFPVGARVRLGGKNVTTLVVQTGSPARIESYADASGPIGAPTRQTGVRSAIGTPIDVEGRLWGVMAAGWSLDEPMPADTEPRLTQFTDLVATAIANAESRAGLARRRFDASRRWSRMGRRRRICSRRSRTRWDGCFQSTWRTCAATSPTLRSHSSPAQGGAFALAPDGPSRGRRTSPRSCSRRAIRPGSTTMPMPPVRSLTTSASRASARRSGRRSSSRGACGA
jgi:GAF domain-containing protein